MAGFLSIKIPRASKIFGGSTSVRSERKAGLFFALRTE
jgi:hypothetical protein